MKSKEGKEGKKRRGDCLPFSSMQGANMPPSGWLVSSRDVLTHRLGIGLCHWQVSFSSDRAKEALVSWGNAVGIMRSPPLVTIACLFISPFSQHPGG